MGLCPPVGWAGIGPGLQNPMGFMVTSRASGCLPDSKSHPKLKKKEVNINRAKVAACGRNPGCSQAHNLGTPTECLTAQHKIVAQRDFVAHHTKCVAQYHFVAQPSFVA